MHSIAGACLVLHVPHPPCKSLPAVPAGRCLGEPGAEQAYGWRHMDCESHPTAGATSSATLTSPEPSTTTPARVGHCKPMQRCLLLPGAGPARLACSATCRQRQCSSDTGRGQQQRRAMNFLLLHQLSLSFNSSQTPDPEKPRSFPSCRHPTSRRRSSRR